MSEIYIYERFMPDTLLGEWQETLDSKLHAQWNEMFGDHPSDGAARAAGLAVACMMRAYLGVVSPRPPGNIHARQVVTLHNLPELGEVIRSRVWCRDKEMRRERRHLTIEVIGSGHENRPLYTGRMGLIWAR